ncbi:DUF3775 domain-containing protein [Sphingobium yanoikuyae]|jgi:hypothetical protein|uniref:Uncharacterized protein n=1 Tax=Sphingobium yanoikuyae TaxID=13690 RepID=A0A0J9CXX5_SPHYA|nr:DUF3775 domain-containing protein [Sphingobium yanoikuyae]ATP17840.1 hypothetical protein BV87_05220 [Sphingobium yanoikuyae]KMW29887.1 hypothetical protein BV87_10435 [Sphingobium yanoikuyae]
MTTPQATLPADPFFETIHDSQWNACVGIQGNEQNYVDGYIEAALELAAAVLDKKLVASRDTLAMPILYNGRHALELSLKFAINRLHAIGAIASRHVPNHDILSHWTHLRDAGLGDAALRELIAELEPYVVSLAKIDDDGQELRYPTTQDGKKSLERIAVVNLPLIRRSLQAMGGILTRLKYRVFALADERGTGTHTKGCSREDLQAIAGMLGDHATWIEDSFDDRKAAARERYGLSSGKFSDAVKQIRGSRQLATLVGMETPLTYLSDEKAVFALEEWAKAFPPMEPDPDDLGTSYFERDWDKVKEHRRVMQMLVDAILANLSDEEVADLEVLFYIGRGGEFGEHYDAMLADAVAEHKLAKSRWEGVYHIMTKTSLLDNVIRGAAAAGRPSLATLLRTIRPA